MMDDSEKPFACSSPGCNMSFINEDHLMVHKKKHDMILNLGIGGKNGVFVADQTPTPTRFIRNCEEVGLFQDLQNVNPFEETFRRAVESGKIGALPESELATNDDDTLHTPHVFPHIEDEPSPCSKTDDEIEMIPETLNNEDKTIIESEIIQNITSKQCITKETETIVIQEADTSIIPPVLTSTPSLSINGKEVQLLLKTQDGSMVQLSAIPVSNNNNNINNNNNNVKQQSKTQTTALKCALTSNNCDIMQKKNSSMSRLSLAKMRLRQALTKNDAIGKITKISQHTKMINDTREFVENKSSTCNDMTKKKDILERNRASSMRSRAKRKEWIQQLERTVKNVNAINATLQLEIRALQNEVTKLKTILLAHHDCPVTKAMEKDNGVMVKSKIDSITSQFIQSIPMPLNDCTFYGIKRNLIVNDIPIVTKKQLLNSPKNTKQAILLPKIDDKSLPVITRIYHENSDASMIKLIDFNNISNNNSIDIDKSILIVQNGGDNDDAQIQVVDTQEIVNVDQSLQLINVASKTTGT